jgi:hypothetical protein
MVGQRFTGDAPYSSEPLRFFRGALLSRSLADIASVAAGLRFAMHNNWPGWRLPNGAVSVAFHEDMEAG